MRSALACRFVLLAGLSSAGAAYAQAPDTILLNGKIVVYDAAPGTRAYNRCRVQSVSMNMSLLPGGVRR